MKYSGLNVFVTVCFLSVNTILSLPPHETDNPPEDKETFLGFKKYFQNKFYSEETNEKFKIATDIAIDCGNKKTNLVVGSFSFRYSDNTITDFFSPQRSSEIVTIGDNIYEPGYAQRMVCYTSGGKPASIMLSPSGSKYKEYERNFYSPHVIDETYEYLCWLDALDFKICFQQWPVNEELGRGIFDVDEHGGFLERIFKQTLGEESLPFLEMKAGRNCCEEAREDYEEKITEWKDEHDFVSQNIQVPNVNELLVTVKLNKMGVVLKNFFYDDLIHLSKQAAQLFDEYRKYVVAFMDLYNHGEMAFLFELNQQITSSLPFSLSLNEPNCLSIRTRLSCCHRCETFLYAYYDYLKEEIGFKDLYFIVFYDEDYQQKKFPISRGDRKVWFLKS